MGKLFIKKIKTMGWENAIIGMRYPKNSEDKSDTNFYSSDKTLGKDDLRLLLQLTQAGRDHRKVLRMIHVQASVNMTMSWWTQYDTYKVATVTNSRSRMHKMGSKLLTKNDFYVIEWTKQLENILKTINSYIKIWQKTKDKNIWLQILDILPISYLQERMIDLNYETLISICRTRWNEKLKTEWNFFIKEFINKCPYLKILWEVSTKKIDIKNIINNKYIDNYEEYYKYNF